MTLPKPVQGLVINYSYLWQAEHSRGRDEGVKNRPCAVILAVRSQGGGEVVTVLPITHTQPADLSSAIELLPVVKRRLGLDTQRSWVVLNEANRFLWPGPDLRPRRARDADSVAYGVLPYKFSEDIRLRFIALLKAHRVTGVDRAK